jgi:hypothetical protein
MCVDARISRSSSKILILFVWYMLVGPGITIFLGQPKVNYVHKIAFLAKAHKKVVWFDVTMNEVLGVYVFNSAYLQTRNAVHSYKTEQLWQQ